MKKIRLLITVSFLACFSLIQAQESINICSFNLRYQTTIDGKNQWVYRRDSVMEMIREYKFDIIGVQEDSKIYHLKDFRYLNEYGIYYGMSGEDKEDAEWCAILYNKYRFSIVSNGTFWLSETPDVPYSVGWDGKYARNCNWVELRDNKNCNTLFIFNTHMDHEGVNARLKGAEVICQKVHEIAGDKPAFIMGDMNCEPGQDPTKILYNCFTYTRDMAPPGKKYGGTGTLHSYGSRTPPLPQIDYIFAANSDLVNVEQYTTLTRKFVMDGYLMYSSDHYPVYTTVTIENK